MEEDVEQLLHEHTALAEHLLNSGYATGSVKRRVRAELEALKRKRAEMKGPD